MSQKENQVQEEISVRRPSSIRGFWYGFITALAIVILFKDGSTIPDGPVNRDPAINAAVMIPWLLFMGIAYFLIILSVIIYGLPFWRYKGEPPQ